MGALKLHCSSEPDLQRDLTNLLSASLAIVRLIACATEYNSPLAGEPHAMRAANFCMECGERLAGKGWRARLGSRLCAHCSQRLGAFASFRPLVIIVMVAVAAFVVGKYRRPSPPPLIIQRAAKSPLSDGPVEFEQRPRLAKGATTSTQAVNLSASTGDDAVYICGARTKKGTPCHRRVHAAGERCFQHKGMAAMLPLEKLTIKP